MALNQSALLELTEALRSADEGQLMRSLLHTILQALIDAEAEAHIGAGPHERSDGRLTQRNGTRAKTVSTTAGDLAVKIPKTRTGSFFGSPAGSVGRFTRLDGRVGVGSTRRG